MFYGNNYFGANNKDCLCPDCKRRSSPAVDFAPSVRIEDEEVNDVATCWPPRDTELDSSPAVEAAPNARIEQEEEEEVNAAEAQIEKRVKKVKGDQGGVECLVCHSIVKRMDKHIETHKDRLPEMKWRKFILDFYRCKNPPPNKKIYDCLSCYKRFASLVTHKHVNKCDCSNVVRVEKPQSRSSIPAEIRKALKSHALPSTNDLEIAEKFVQYRNQLAVCGGNEKWSQDRMGIKHLMALFYNRTNGLTQAECLVGICLELQKERNLKPQSMLNYLSTFALFCDYCFLYSVGVSSASNGDRFRAAIRDARKAFAPAAVANYRETAQEMMAKVPNCNLVRQRIKQILNVLRENLEDNKMSYKTQQSLNFFLLQARLNTR